MDRIKHKRMGEGTIISRDKDLLTVRFDKTGKEINSKNVGYEGIKIASYRDGTAVSADMKLDYYEYGADE